MCSVEGIVYVICLSLDWIDWMFRPTWLLEFVFCKKNWNLYFWEFVESVLLKMKLVDAEDTACRFHGHGFQVVFYCHTCHTLLCPRCLTKGQLAVSTDHMGHVYVDIKEAVDIVKVRSVYITLNHQWQITRSLFRYLEEMMLCCLGCWVPACRPTSAIEMISRIGQGLYFL